MVEDYPRTLIDLEARFSNEDSCREYLFSVRWPEGFVCPHCGRTGAWRTARGLWVCRACRTQVSVTAGTIFQHSRLPLRIWFRAMWQIASQKHGISALGLQRALGLGSYRTAWLMLHKLRRAMVRPGRERLSGTIEVGVTSWGGDETPAGESALIAIAAEAAPGRERAIGRVRLRRIPDLERAALHSFIRDSVEPGSTVVTDDREGYVGLPDYRHEPHVLRSSRAGEAHLLPRAHQVASLLRRWLMGTHHGAIAHEHIDDYLNEFVFRFNRRWSSPRGRLFLRLVQQTVVVKPVPYKAVKRAKRKDKVEVCAYLTRSFDNESRRR